MIDNKILEDEAMSDDELNNVAGGTSYEMADDSRFLNSLNGSCDRYGATKILFNGMFSDSIKTEVENAWATVGIKARCDYDLYCATSNVYSLNGRKITQEQARQHAMKVVGKQMTESDWKW